MEQLRGSTVFLVDGPCSDSVLRCISSPQSVCRVAAGARHGPCAVMRNEAWRFSARDTELGHDRLLPEISPGCSALGPIQAR